jgi:hypothetical protein
MKMDEDHSVPPTTPALAILDAMRDGSQGDLIFPATGDEPFSDMAMLAVLDRLALLWQIYRSIGFPNQVFNDSWVVGFWRAGHGRQTVELERRACALA